MFPYVSSVIRLSCADVEGALAFVAEASELDVAEPFPRRALDLIGRLIPSDGVVYQEYEHKRSHPSFFIEDPQVPLTESVWESLGSRASDNPLRDKLRRRERRALRLSDFLSVRLVRRNPFWAESLRLQEPYGGPYHLRIWLAAPEGQTRQLGFVRRSGDFKERERMLLELLRPHLMRLRMNLEVRRLASLRAREALGLTPRELEVLVWVACGKANAEIATVLYVAEGTVRKHMDNILTKLGVHTRTAAVHRAFLARPGPS
jgi:DNA-binding CsgD family transcriptional regulator